MKNIIDINLLNELWEQAKASPRLRMHYDLRNSEKDTSQRILNALLPGTEVPIHRHEATNESFICLCGKMEVIFYEPCDSAEGGFKEIERHLLCPAEGKFGLQLPAGMWHGVNVIEPSVIFEAKDGGYVG